MVKSSFIATGVDIVAIDRIAQAVAQWQDSFLRRIFTDKEIQYCNNAASRLAVRFAAKEAVMKALGCGMFNLRWCDIEILAQESGKPYINLSGRSKIKANEKGISDISVSLSHEKHYAIAFVVAYAK